MSAYKKNPDNLDTKRFAILVRDSQIRLTFTELESLTSFRTSRFLTFNSTRVTSNETFCTKSGFVFRIDLNQCASDSQASCLRLSFEATSIEVDLDIILFCNVQLCERLLNNELKDCRRKVISQITFVDSNLSCTFAYEYASNCCLTSSYCIYYFNCDYLYEFISINLCC